MATIDQIRKDIEKFGTDDFNETMVQIVEELEDVSVKDTGFGSLSFLGSTGSPDTRESDPRNISVDQQRINFNSGKDKLKSRKKGELGYIYHNIPYTGNVITPAQVHQAIVKKINRPR